MMKKRMDENTEQKIQFVETETETGKKPVWREKLHQMLAELDEVVTPEDAARFDSKWDDLEESLNCIRLY